MHPFPLIQGFSPKLQNPSSSLSRSFPLQVANLKLDLVFGVAELDLMLAVPKLDLMLIVLELISWLVAEFDLMLDLDLVLALPNSSRVDLDFMLVVNERNLVLIVTITAYLSQTGQVGRVDLFNSGRVWVLTRFMIGSGLNQVHMGQPEYDPTRSNFHPYSTLTIILVCNDREFNMVQE